MHTRWYVTQGVKKPNPDALDIKQADGRVSHSMILKGNFAVADWVLCVLALVLLACLVVFKPRSKSRRVYPPGPPRHPIWGNLFNFPRVRWHETFTEWQKSWGMSYSPQFAAYHWKETPSTALLIDNFLSPGEFIYVSFLGMPMLIVQDREIADELMNKRGNQYSDRPRSVMCGDLCVLLNNLSTSRLS